MIYRFLGTESNIGATRLQRFGQAVELTEDAAKEAMQKCAIVPDAAFQKIGFTEDELKAFANVGSHAGATESFLSKKQRVLVMLHELREGKAAPDAVDNAGNEVE